MRFIQAFHSPRSWLALAKRVARGDSALSLAHSLIGPDLEAVAGRADHGLRARRPARRQICAAADLLIQELGAGWVVKRAMTKRIAIFSKAHGGGAARKKSGSGGMRGFQGSRSAPAGGGLDNPASKPSKGAIEQTIVLKEGRKGAGS